MSASHRPEHALSEPLHQRSGPTPGSFGMTTGATPYMPIHVGELHELPSQPDGVATSRVCGPDGRVPHSPTIPRCQSVRATTRATTGCHGGLGEGCTIGRPHVHALPSAVVALSWLDRVEAMSRGARALEVSRMRSLRTTIGRGGSRPPTPTQSPETRRGKPGDQNPRTSPSKPNKSSELKAHKTTRRPRQSCPRSPRTAGLEAKMEASLIGIQVGHFALAFKTTPPEAPNHMALTTLGHQTQRHEQHSHDTRRDDGQEDAQPTRGPSPSTTRVLGQPAHSTPRGPQVHLGGRSSRPSHATSGNPAKDTTRPHPQSAHQAQLYTSTLEARQRGLTRGGPNAALLDPASTRPWHARHHYRRVRGRCDGQARKPDSNTAWHDRTTPCCHQHPKACGPDDQ